MNDEATITITLKEYKELLVIKGKYEELKERIQPIEWVPNRTTITYTNADDLFEKEVKPYKVTSYLSQCDDKI